jgi:hypothetical protein
LGSLVLYRHTSLSSAPYTLLIIFYQRTFTFCTAGLPHFFAKIPSRKNILYAFCATCTHFQSFVCATENWEFFLHKKPTENPSAFDVYTCVGKSANRLEEGSADFRRYQPRNRFRPWENSCSSTRSCRNLLRAGENVDFRRYQPIFQNFSGY